MAKDAATVEAVQPPPLRRGRAKHVTDPEVLSALVDVMASGQWASPSETYENQKAANSAIQYLKRDLVGNGHFGDKAGVTARAWQDGDVWRIALKPKGE